MADVRNIVTRSALTTALEKVADAIKGVASAISEKLTTKTLTVQDYAYISELEVPCGITSPTVDDLQREIDRLKKPVRLTGVKLHNDGTSTKAYIFVEVDTSFFGEGASVGSERSLYFRVTFNDYGVTLTTSGSAALLTSSQSVAENARSFPCAVAVVPSIQCYVPKNPAVGSSVSVNIIGDYTDNGSTVVFYEGTKNYTVLAK